MLEYRHASRKSTTKSKKIWAISVNLESYINNYKNMADTNNMNLHASASGCHILIFFEKLRIVVLFDTQHGCFTDERKDY
jgi:hypothetical protein